MTSPQDNIQQQTSEVKQNDKEYNFRQLEAKYQRQLEQEKAGRLEAEKRNQELMSRNQVHNDDEEDDSEPYVDHKRLAKKFSSFEKKMEERIDKKAQERAQIMYEQGKQESWLKTNNDFYDVMQHAEKFAQHDPELAESILAMPEGFERQKLVYKNIKALGLHKPPGKEPSIQDKVDANRRYPGYQPSGIGTSPYSQQGDFSKTGQKNAYDKMKELQQRLRL